MLLIFSGLIDSFLPANLPASHWYRLAWPGLKENLIFKTGRVLVKNTGAKGICLGINC